MSLTEHQEEVLDQGINILSKNNRLLIKGSAGVGKTYLAKEFIERVYSSLKRSIICVTAPTHKAVAVLKGKIPESDKVEFSTIHSILKLKRNVNKQSGEIFFAPAFDPKYPPLKGVGLLIIDEASMISTEILEIVEEYAKRFSVKVVFLGDEKQLNPVGEENTPVFNANYPTVELTEIIRQGAGNPIIDLSRNLPLLGSKNNNFFVEDETMNGYLFSNDKQKVVDTLAKVNGTNEFKYLAWTNKEVDMMNFMVRRAIYGNPAKLERGETLVLNAPYNERYYTNEETKIVDLQVIEKEITYPLNKYGKENPQFGEQAKTGKVKLKVYVVTTDKKVPLGDSPESFKLTVIHEESEKEYTKIVNIVKQSAKFRNLDWIDYYRFTEKFADLKYNHAISVHKSQGSTYQKAIINLKNLLLNRNEEEKQRLLYTAVTRASKLLIVYNH